MDPYELTTRIEEADGLDRLVDVVERAIPAALRTGRVRDALAGTDVGHALHPPMTDAPMGLWMGATVLGVLGPRRWRWPSAALTGLGLAAAAPTIASGIVEWRDTRQREKRVGLVHAAATGAATTAFAVSLVAKVANRTRLGTLAAIGGMASAGVGGYLGGHLAFARGAGVDRTIGQRARTEAFAVEPEADPFPGVSRVRELRGEAFFVTRDAGRPVAVADRCTRCGETLRIAAHDLASCPTDASRFELGTGRVSQGPATTPLPTFLVDETAAGLRLRAR